MTDIVEITKTVMSVMSVSGSERDTIFQRLLAEFPEQVCDMISQLNLKETLQQLGPQATGQEYSYKAIVPVVHRHRVPHLTKEEYDNVDGLIFYGKKVEAIKEIRAITGLGLKESKDIVEGWDQLVKVP